MQSDGFNSALSPVVYGDIALSINTHYITSWLKISRDEGKESILVGQVTTNFPT